MGHEQPSTGETTAAEDAFRRQGLDPASFRLEGIVVVARDLEAFAREGELDLGDRDFRAELLALREPDEAAR